MVFQNKNFHSLQSEILQNKTSKFHKAENLAIFLTLFETPAPLARSSLTRTLLHDRTTSPNLNDTNSPDPSFRDKSLGGNPQIQCPMAWVSLIQDPLSKALRDLRLEP